MRQRRYLCYFTFLNLLLFTVSVNTEKLFCKIKGNFQGKNWFSIFFLSSLVLMGHICLCCVTYSKYMSKIDCKCILSYFLFAHYSKILKLCSVYRPRKLWSTWLCRIFSEFFAISISCFLLQIFFREWTA